DAEIVGTSAIKVSTTGITRLTFMMPRGTKAFSADANVTVEIDGTKLSAGRAESGKLFSVGLRKEGNLWQIENDDGPRLRLDKEPGLQGPIDDAFLSRFIMVKPTGTPMNDAVGKWADTEMKHAITHWRQQFRGEAIVKTDSEIAEDDFRSNLVLWGDPSSNAILAKIADKLPVKWTKDSVILGAKAFAADTNVPVFICRNPLNMSKYVVINSGFTFREYDYLNNARQVPKLPDYAVIDATSPMTSRAPGKIVAAGFFDEGWQLPADRK